MQELTLHKFSMDATSMTIKEIRQNVWRNMGNIRSLQLKKHFEMTVLWVLNADAVINVIKFWEHRYMCHPKNLLLEAVLLWQPFSCALAIKVFWGVYQTRISMSYSINSCGLFFQRNNLILLRQRLFLFYCLLQFDCTILVLNTHLQAYWIMQNWNFICVCKASKAAWIMTEWGIESMLSGKHLKRKATL